MTPLVSIVIPTYNRADLITETLDSILTQTYVNWECIVVDDGSTDDTANKVSEYCKKDVRFQYVKRPIYKIKGANSCRNYGLTLSIGEFVNFFDSDDVMCPEKLELQVKRLLATNSVLCVCQSLLFNNDNPNETKIKRKQLYTVDFFNDFVCQKLKWLTPEPLFQKQFLTDNAIEFDERLSQSQDRDFMLKVFSRIDTYAYIEQPLVNVRQHGCNISSGYSKSKNWSNFRVSYNTLTLYKGQLSDNAIAYTIRRMVKTYKVSLEHKSFALALKQLKYLCRFTVKCSTQNKIKLCIAFVSYRCIGRGEQFFSILNSRKNL
ncbi:MAG: glycosyltransferase family 2 protein [Flavobacteriaceae bacterium]